MYTHGAKHTHVMYTHTVINTLSDLMGSKRQRSRELEQYKVRIIIILLLCLVLEEIDIVICLSKNFNWCARLNT